MPKYYIVKKNRLVVEVDGQLDKLAAREASGLPDDEISEVLTYTEFQAKTKKPGCRLKMDTGKAAEENEWDALNALCVAAEGRGMMPRLLVQRRRATIEAALRSIKPTA